ncbi:hypothetical protein C8Q74DRAFT_664108 [Fomes fomentarius]|nr:hypothetical protein C8Q74DRAFT_664108 [Fomes fomentarius]
MLASETDRQTHFQTPSSLHDYIIQYSRTSTMAGMEMSLNALSRIVHVLAERPEVQMKPRAEIKDARARLGEDVSYDDLVKLPYLDAVVRETLCMGLHCPEVSARHTHTLRTHYERSISEPSSSSTAGAATAPWRGGATMRTNGDPSGEWSRSPLSSRRLTFPGSLPILRISRDEGRHPLCY